MAAGDLPIAVVEPKFTDTYTMRVTQMKSSIRHEIVNQDGVVISKRNSKSRRYVKAIVVVTTRKDKLRMTKDSLETTERWLAGDRKVVACTSMEEMIEIGHVTPKYTWDVKRGQDELDSGFEKRLATIAKYEASIAGLKEEIADMEAGRWENHDPKPFVYSWHMKTTAKVEARVDKWRKLAVVINTEA